MPRSPLEHVVGRWSTLVEGVQVRPQKFYAAVERALEHRDIPESQISTINYSEGGIFHIDREYLRIRRHGLVFDICAAPYGTGSFFSWWLTQRPPGFAGLYLVLMAVVSFLIASALGSVLPIRLGIWNAVVLVPLGVLVVFAVAALLARAGVRGPDAALRATDLIGPLYGALFSPPSFYSFDTLSMFQAAAHAAVTEAVDEVLNRRGLRRLSPEERKPIFRELMFGTAATSGEVDPRVDDMKERTEGATEAEKEPELVPSS